MQGLHAFLRYWPIAKFVTWNWTLDWRTIQARECDTAPHALHCWHLWGHLVGLNFAILIKTRNTITKYLQRTSNKYLGPAGSWRKHLKTASSKHNVQLPTPLSPSPPACTCPLVLFNITLTRGSTLHCISTLASAITTRQNYPEPPRLSCHQQHGSTPRYIIVSHTEVQYEVWSTKIMWLASGPDSFQMTAVCESNLVPTRTRVISKPWLIASSIHSWQLICEDTME